MFLECIEKRVSEAGLYSFVIAEDNRNYIFVVPNCNYEEDLIRDREKLKAILNKSKYNSVFFDCNYLFIELDKLEKNEDVLNFYQMINYQCLVVNLLYSLGIRKLPNNLPIYYAYELERLLIAIHNEKRTDYQRVMEEYFLRLISLICQN